MQHASVYLILGLLSHLEGSYIIQINEKHLFIHGIFSSFESVSFRAVIGLDVIHNYVSLHLCTRKC